MVRITHTGGSLTLTPDHVLSLDDQWLPARLAQAGTRLSNGAIVHSVSATTQGIINPLTSTGTILADGVLASVYPEWIASHMLSSTVYPLPLSACNILAAAFPQSAQAFYDAALEPIFAGGRRAYLEAVPAALVAPAIVAMDLTITAAFVAVPLILTTSAALVARQAGLMASEC